jgi:hypothetical protein
MINTRTLLREEIALNDRKILLNEQSMSLIQNSDYVKHVLGIQIPLVEYYSFEIRKQIIEEQIKMQDVLMSAAKMSGIPTFTINVINSAKNIKDIATLFKDLILSPELMVQANTALSKVCQDLSSKILSVVNWIKNTLKTNIIGFTDKIMPILEKVSDTLIKQTSLNGWTGFLSKLGFCVIVTYVYNTVLIKLMSGGVEFFKDNPPTLLLSGISEVLNMFKNFKNFIVNNVDISQIIDFFSMITKSILFVKLKAAFNLLGIISLILAPVIASLKWPKKLQKK